MPTSVEEELSESVSEDADSVIGPGAPQVDAKMMLMKRLVRQIRDQLDALDQLLDGVSAPEGSEAVWSDDSDVAREVRQALQDRMVDGVFDGEQMIGEDGKKYLVPPNYASKSKLVEGDLLRLNIHPGGRFIYKQKGPIERQRMLGTLVHDEQTDAWNVLANGSKYRIIAASVSFFKGQAGDEVVVLTPKNAPSHWAAVENIIHRTNVE